MTTFEEFVTRLGDFAKNYTPEQLRQLHADVHQFAEIVIAIHRAKRKGRRKHSPQRPLDGTPPDRTLKKNTSPP